jgi:hypothetical protein
MDPLAPPLPTAASGNARNLRAQAVGEGSIRPTE